MNGWIVSDFFNIGKGWAWQVGLRKRGERVWITLEKGEFTVDGFFSRSRIHFKSLYELQTVINKLAETLKNSPLDYSASSRGDFE